MNKEIHYMSGISQVFWFYGIGKLVDKREHCVAVQGTFLMVQLYWYLLRMPLSTVFENK